MGVPITGTLGPTDPTDVFAVTDPLTAIDGWRSVADETVRNLIVSATPLRCRQGMAIWTQGDSSLWTLNAPPWAGDDTDWTEFTGSGGGSGTVTSVAVESANGFAGTVANDTTAAAITLTTSITGILKGNGTAISAATAGTDYVIPSVVTLSDLVITESQVTGLSTTLTTLAGDISTIDGAGYLTANQTITLSGDATGSGTTAITTTLATVNSDTSAVGSSTSIPTVTANAKGLVTAVTGNVVIAPAGTLSGTTLNATVVTSSLTTVGTIGTGVWQGTAITGAHIASSVALAGSPTTTTQTALDDSTKVATTAYVDAAVTAGGGGGTGTITAGNIGNLAYYTINGGTTLAGETLSAVIDGYFGSTQGDVLYRNSGSWAAPAPSTAGEVLATGGASANPSWVAIVAPAGTLSGTTLNSTVVTSSLTTVGTIATGVWNGTAVAIANGGTGQTAQTAAFDALSPLTTLGDTLYFGSSHNVRLAGNITTAKQFYSQTGVGASSAAPAWAAILATDLPAIAANTILANNTGGSAAPTAVTTGLTISQHNAVVNVPSGTSGTITCNLALGDWQAPAACTGAFTLALSNPTTGQTFAMFLTQASSGGPYAVTWFSGITWIGSPYTAPTMPATASAVLTAVFRCVSSGVYYGWWLGNSAA